MMLSMTRAPSSVAAFIATLVDELRYKFATLRWLDEPREIRQLSLDLERSLAHEPASPAGPSHDYLLALSTLDDDSYFGQSNLSVNSAQRSSGDARQTPPVRDRRKSDEIYDEMLVRLHLRSTSLFC